MKYILTILFLAFLIIGCKPQEVLLIKENTPSVLTKSALNVTRYSVTLSAEVTDEGFTATTDRGFVYSDKNSNPSVSDSKASSGYGKGTYSIILDKLPVNTKYYFRAYATNTKGTAYGDAQSFTTLDNTTKIVEVKSRTGRIWMDRNLGASQVATSPNDEKAFGDLYQWGRSEDGHQKRTSTTTKSQSSADFDSNINFILPQSQPLDWRSPQNDKLWQGVNGINNPCPSGYRLPTLEEWGQEIQTWGKGDITGFLSPLKLINAGARDFTQGTVGQLEAGFYWSSNVFGNSARSRVFIRPQNFYEGASVRAAGYSVRCIKD